MSFPQKLNHELKALGLASLFFGAWIGAFMLLKVLILAEYRIQFHGLSLVAVGTLVLAKAVLILEHVPLPARFRARPAWVEVLLRTALYAAGVFLLLLLEKAFEARHEHGGFLAALISVCRHADAHQVLANTICLSGALAAYNALAVVRGHLGPGGLVRLFFSLPPDGTPPRSLDDHSQTISSKTDNPNQRHKS